MLLFRLLRLGDFLARFLRLLSALLRGHIPLLADCVLHQGAVFFRERMPLRPSRLRGLGELFQLRFFFGGVVWHRDSLFLNEFPREFQTTVDAFGGRRFGDSDFFPEECKGEPHHIPIP